MTCEKKLPSGSIAGGGRRLERRGRRRRGDGIRAREDARVCPDGVRDDDVQEEGRGRDAGEERAAASGRIGKGGAGSRRGSLGDDAGGVGGGEVADARGQLGRRGYAVRLLVQFSYIVRYIKSELNHHRIGWIAALLLQMIQNNSPRTSEDPPPLDRETLTRWPWSRSSPASPSGCSWARARSGRGPWSSWRDPWSYRGAWTRS